MQPYFSIITASRNAAKSLPRLLASLEKQNFTSFELVVQDATSSDGTLQLLDNASQWLPSIQVSSQKDQGIYDAWNKAISRAMGQWLLFLGADDQLAAPDVLEKASHILYMLPPNVKFAAGAVRMLDKAARCRLYARPILTGGNSRLKYIAPVAFPGLFIRRQLVANNPFDARLKISADYDFLCRTWKDQQAVSLEFDVCIMEEGGISSNPANQFAAAWENTQIASRHFQNVWEIKRIKMLIKAGLVSGTFRILGPKRGALALDAVRRLRGLAPCWKK